MPKGKKVVSKAQAGLIGIAAGGNQPKAKISISQANAKDMLRGVSVKKLPEYVAKSRKQVKRGKKK